MQATNNPVADEIREEMAQIRAYLGFVWKHVNRGAEKVDMVNDKTTPPPPADDNYYEEDMYALMVRMGVSNRKPKAPIQRIGVKVKEIMAGTIGFKKREGQYVRDGNYNRNNNFNRGNYGNRNDRSGPYFPPQNREVSPRYCRVSMA